MCSIEYIAFIVCLQKRTKYSVTKRSLIILFALEKGKFCLVLENVLSSMMHDFLPLFTLITSDVNLRLSKRRAQYRFLSKRELQVTYLTIRLNREFNK